MLQPRKDKKKETTIKMVFTFVLRRGRHFSEPKKDDGARCCGKGASVPRRARNGNKTQQSKRELRADIPRKEKETTIKMVFLSYSGEGAISQSQRKMMARNAVARAPHQCLSARAMVKHNNKPELIFHFHIPMPTSCHHLLS